MSKKLLVLLLSGGLLLAACGEDSAAGDNSTPETSQEGAEAEAETTETEEQTTAPEGDSAKLTIGDSKEIDGIKFTVTNSYYTDERNEFAETSPEKVIAIEYTIENNSEDDYPFGMDEQVYVDGKQAETYPLDNSMGSVSAGRSADGIVFYGVDGDTVELEWAPMFSFSGEKGVWDVTP